MRAVDEISAVRRTGDLDEPFRAAADGADLLAQRRARALGFPLVANGTQHSVNV